jgi:hypothetical protein
MPASPAGEVLGSMSTHGGTQPDEASVRQAPEAGSAAACLFKGLLLIVQAAFLGTGMLVTPLAVFAAESADIDQCANDPAPSSPANGCATSASDWVNGNLNASKSVFLEGDSIPYRIKFGDLRGRRLAIPSPSSGTRRSPASMRSTT